MLYIRFIMSALTIFSLSARGSFCDYFGGSVLGSFTGSVLGNAMTQPRTVIVEKRISYDDNDDMPIRRRSKREMRSIQKENNLLKEENLTLKKQQDDLKKRLDALEKKLN